MLNAIAVFAAIAFFKFHYTTSLFTEITCDSSLQAHHRDGDMVMMELGELYGSSRVRRSSDAHDTLLVADAAYRLLKRHARPEVQPNDTISELTQRDVILGQIKDYFVGQFLQEDQDQVVKDKAQSVLSFLDQRRREVGSHLENYRRALYAQAVSPDSRLRVTDLDRISYMIEEARRTKFEIPLLNHAAESFTGLVYFQFINMAQAEQIAKDNRQAMRMMADGHTEALGSVKTLREYKEGIRNVTERLFNVMNDTGATLSKDLDLIQSLDIVASMAIKNIRNSQKFARFVLAISEAAGYELEDWSRAMRKKVKELEEGTAKEVVAQVIVQADGQLEVVKNRTDSMYLTKDLCIPGIEMTEGKDGKPEFIGDEYVTSESMTRAHAVTMLWDFYLGCAIPISDGHKVPRRIKRSAHNLEEMLAPAKEDITKVIRRMRGRANNCNQAIAGVTENLKQQCARDVEELKAKQWVEIQQLHEALKLQREQCNQG
uniref:Uncharacterized protein n=1 Tax=Soberanes virus TaxID=3139882 RepID=A0AAN0N8M9_9VIRU